MTNVNNAENPSTDGLNQNHNQNKTKKPTKKLIHSFNKLFNEAKADTQGRNDTTVLRSTEKKHHTKPII